MLISDGLNGIWSCIGHGAWHGTWGSKGAWLVDLPDMMRSICTWLLPKKILCTLSEDHTYNACLQDRYTKGNRHFSHHICLLFYLSFIFLFIPSSCQSSWTSLEPLVEKNKNISQFCNVPVLLPVFVISPPPKCKCRGVSCGAMRPLGGVKPVTPVTEVRGSRLRFLFAKLPAFVEGKNRDTFKYQMIIK